MPKPPTNQDSLRGEGRTFLDHVVLVFVLFVMSLRTTLVEPVQSSSAPGNIGDVVQSLYISVSLILAVVLWLMWNFCGRRFSYRFSGMEIGFCLLVLASVLSGLAAPDKRQAVNHVVGFLAPPLMAILLVQVLDSYPKTKVALAVIAALGVVSACEGIEQQLVSNQLTIEQYEQDPNSFLEQLAIERDSLQHFMFEHRLYSQGVHGFFTNRNSLGSFLIMAFFAALALLLDKYARRGWDDLRPIHLLACGSAVAVILLGLVLTRSKGAIVGSFVAIMLFAAWIHRGGWLKRHGRAILIVGLFLIVGSVCSLACYGLKHDKLPGGASMLVRWQYWHAAAQMYADHPFLGVGPGNFTHFYTHYKPPSALEAVADPHNLPLSIITQYGPFGLAAFLAMACIPLLRAVSGCPPDASAKAHPREQQFSKLALVCLLAVSLLLLIVRPMLMSSTPTDAVDVMIYIIIRLYVTPVALFVIAFFLLTVPLTGSPDSRPQTPGVRVTKAALLCAMLGVASHNLIDFAIFEPGVWTTFWAMMACLIAADVQHKDRRNLVITLPSFVRVLVPILATVAVWSFLRLGVIPVARSSAKIQRARQAASAGRLDAAHQLLDEAAQDDTLSSAALSMNARLYIRQFETAPSPDRRLLLKSAECLQISIERNTADFKDFERLAEVYALLGETSTAQQRADWLNKAFDAALLAVERYPGCERIRIAVARIAEQLGKTEIALQQYRTAVDIEDSYRRQFRTMYPQRADIVSRIGQDKYLFAKQRIEVLSLTPPSEQP